MKQNSGSGGYDPTYFPGQNGSGSNGSKPMTTEEKKIVYGDPCPECGLSMNHGSVPCNFPYPDHPLPEKPKRVIKNVPPETENRGNAGGEIQYKFTLNPKGKIHTYSPETRREWEKTFDLCFLGVGNVDWEKVRLFIKEQVIPSALAQGEKIGAEKERERMLKIQSKRVGASIKKNPKRHSLHSLLTYYKKKKNGFMVKVIQEKLNALKGTL